MCGTQSFSCVAAGLEFFESVQAHCCHNTVFKGFQRSVCFRITTVHRMHSKQVESYT